MLRLSPLAALVLAGSASTQGGNYFPPAETAGGWRSLVTPNQPPTGEQTKLIRKRARMHPDGLLAAWNLVQPHGGSFLVIRRGWIAAEWGPAGTQHVASCAKSLTGLAIMKMLDMGDQGAWTNPIELDDPVFPHLPASWLNGEPTKADILLEHLLTMSSGLLYHDSPQPNSSYYSTVLAQPMANTPGTVWTYGSLQVDLLSPIVTDVTGLLLEDFFDLNVGSMIGMPSFGWQNMGTHTVASAYAYLTARDIARPAYLLLRDGRWGGQQVISEARVAYLTQRASILQGATFGQPNSPFVSSNQSHRFYGPLYWTNADHLSPLGPDVPADAFYMAGFGTDFVVGIPSEDLIVVRLGSAPTPFDDDLFAAVVGTVVDAILPRWKGDWERLPQPTGGLIK